MGPFSQLLTMVAAALVPFHVNFRLPEADRKALVGTGVYEKQQTQEALLLLKFRQKHLAHDSNGLVQLAGLCVTAHDTRVPGRVGASAQSRPRRLLASVAPLKKAWLRPVVLADTRSSRCP